LLLPHVFRFRGLFWKFFLAFLSSSVLVLLATTYVVLNTIESARVKENHRASVLKISQKIVEQYEAQVSPRRRLPKINMEATDAKAMIGRHRIHLEIYEGERKIFDSVPKRRLRNANVELSVESLSGKVYQARTSVGFPKRKMREALHRLNLLQLGFIFFGAALVSAVLSFIVTRPLKKLGAYSRRYAAGDRHQRIESSLLARGDELGDLSRDVDNMTQQIEKNIRAQQQLLHDVSHELRAPLARLQAAAGVLQNKIPSEDEHSDRIHLECARINELIQQILDFSRLEHIVGEKVSIALPELLEQLLDNLRFEFPEQVFNTDFGNSPLSIIGYADVLARALENILRNASKYSYTEKPIDIAITSTYQQICIEIKDYGEGVPEGELDSLLQPFFRAGNQMHTDGFGLGLSIAKRAIDLHLGTLSLANHERGGLCVTILLPIS